MNYAFLKDLTESRMFPSRKALEKEDFSSLTEAAFIMILALRILIAEEDPFAERFVRRIVQSSHFRQWRGDGNDLYMALHSLSIGLYPEEGDRPETLNLAPVMRWLREIKRADPRDEVETARLFVRLDRMLWIRESSLRAVRRLIQDWPELSDYDKRLAITRLLQMMRARTPRCELFPALQKMARVRKWEFDDVCDAETGDNCEEEEPKPGRGYKDPLKPKSSGSFLASLAGLATGAAGGYAVVRNKPVKENASCGATGASSVATVVGAMGVGGMGPGFAGPKGDKGIYEPVVLRRGEAPKKKKK